MTEYEIRVSMWVELSMYGNLPILINIASNIVVWLWCDVKKKSLVDVSDVFFIILISITSDHTNIDKVTSNINRVGTYKTNSMTPRHMSHEHIYSLSLLFVFAELLRDDIVCSNQSKYDEAWACMLLLLTKTVITVVTATVFNEPQPSVFDIQLSEFVFTIRCRISVICLSHSILFCRDIFVFCFGNHWFYNNNNNKYNKIDFVTWICRFEQTKSGVPLKRKLFVFRAWIVTYSL